MIFPDFSYEIPLWKKGVSVLGVDEAGRGAFAGPLAIGGVLLNKDASSKLSNLKINDSKLLSAKKREELYEVIKHNSIFSHVELVDLDVINKIGIAKATVYGMEKIYKKTLSFSKDVHAIIDAFKIPSIENHTSIIHGDRISISVASASILAKVERDKHMKELSSKFSKYGWDKNKGYGTAIHRKALERYGPCEHHRTQFVSGYV